MSNESSSPELSVVVVILGGGAHVERFLTAIQQQENPPTMEVIVPYDDRRTEIEPLRAKFPEATFVRVPGEHSYPELRSAGVRAARGRLVGVTEDQCILNPRWCANVVKAHAAEHAAIGGPVDKQRPDALLNWAVYLRELGTYMSPIVEGPTGALTDCNVTYRREVLEKIRPVWAERFDEPSVHGALTASGGTLWITPALGVLQQRTMVFGPALRERFAFGRLYGSLRAATISPVKRLVLMAACAVLPFVLVGRVLAAVFAKRRYIGPALGALPYMLLFAVVWVSGEFVGYLTRRAG